MAPKDSRIHFIVSVRLRPLFRKPPLQYQPLCNKTINPSSPDYYVPAQEGWWACSTGLTPCVHGQVLNKTKGFCVLVQLLPKILYHSEEEIYQIFE